MEENESSVRRQVFAGSILKCPNCGAQITSDTAKCPSCGFIIEKKSVSTAMEEFVKKFIALASDAEKKEFIESYPVPNNKEDIRGLLNYAASQRDKDYKDAASRVFWVDAWNNKCRLIVNQAVDVFGADVEFTRYLKDYKADVEASSAENNRLRGRLRLAKLLKIGAAAAAVLAVVATISIVSVSRSRKRAALIAGCTVPKEHVSIRGYEKVTQDNDGKPFLEILSDATVVTTSISQRVETSSTEPVWCLDTTVTVDVLVTGNIREHIKENFKVASDYYDSSEFTGQVWFRTIPEYIDCSYQSQSVSKHSFDNILAIAEEIMCKETIGKQHTLTFRLTQIAGSRKECEELAIKLHESGEFKFDITAHYDQYYEYWKANQSSKK